MPGPFRVDLKHCAKYEGECATGVQYVFAKAGKPLGRTALWREGVKVKGNNIKPGTAIASFRNGRFRQDHAAILVKETKNGLIVWDQYNPPKIMGKAHVVFQEQQ